MSRLTGNLTTNSIVNDSELIRQTELSHQVSRHRLILETCAILCKSSIVIVSLNEVHQVNLTIVEYRVSSRHRNSTIALNLIPALISLVGILSSDCAQSRTVTNSLIEVVLTNLMRISPLIRLLPEECVLIKSLLRIIVSQSNDSVQARNYDCIVRVHAVSLLILLSIRRNVDLKRYEGQILLIRFVTTSCLVNLRIPCRISSLLCSPVVEVTQNLIIVNLERNSKDTILNLVELTILREGLLLSLRADRRISIATGINRSSVVIETNVCTLDVSNRRIQVIVCSSTPSNIHSLHLSRICIGQNRKKSVRCGSNLIHIDSKFAVTDSLTTGIRPTHSLLYPNIDKLLSSRLAEQLILELIRSALNEYGSLRDERSLNSLDTFPVEVGLQNESSEFLVHEKIKSRKFTTDCSRNLVAQRLELSTQFCLVRLEVILQICDSGINVNLANLCLNLSNLVLQLGQSVRSQIVCSFYTCLESLESSNLSLN